MVRNATGEAPAQLDLPDMPRELGYPLMLFNELAGARRYAQGTPLPLAPTEIAAWFALRGIRPNARLLWYIRALDGAWRRAMATGAKGLI